MRWGDDEEEEMEATGEEASDGEAEFGSSGDFSESEMSASSGGSEEEEEKQEGRRHERSDVDRGARGERNQRGRSKESRGGEETGGRKRKGESSRGQGGWQTVQGRKRREDEERRKRKKEGNPALKFVLQKRGMEEIGRIIKVETDLTIEMFYRGEEATMNPRKKMEDLMERMSQEDPQIEFLAGEGQEDIMEGALDDPEFHRLIRTKEIKKRTSTVTKVTIRSTRLLKSMKHENGGRFVRWLTKERIVINIDKWKREPYADIGFFILRHPTVTWKPDMERQVREKIEEDTKNGGDSEGIPKFLLYHGTKAFGTGKGRVHATVIYVQCRAEDANTLKRLLGKGKSTKGLALIPAGYHLSSSPKRVLQVLNEHNRYVNSTKMIAIVGMFESQMNMTISRNGEDVVVKELLKKKLGVKYIERTNRTKDIGKWLIVAEAKKSGETQQKLDDILDEIGEELGQGSAGQTLSMPRRTDRSIMETKYRRYLESLKDVIPETEDIQPVLQIQNRSRAQIIEDRKPEEDRTKKSFSEVARGTRARQSTDQKESREIGKGSETAGESYEERAEALQDKFEAKLKAHVQLNEDRMLKESMDSQERLLKTLESHSEKSRKIMQSMVSQTEEKIERLGNHMNEKIEEVTKMYRVLTGQFSEVEKLVRAAVTKGQQVEVTPSKSPTRAQSNEGQWHERKSAYRGGPAGRGE